MNGSLGVTKEHHIDVGTLGQHLGSGHQSARTDPAQPDLHVGERLRYVKLVRTKRQSLLGQIDQRRDLEQVREKAERGQLQKVSTGRAQIVAADVGAHGNLAGANQLCRVS